MAACYARGRRRGDDRARSLARRRPHRRAHASLVNLWWLAGLWAQGGYGIDILRYTETAEVGGRGVDRAPRCCAGLGYWFFYGGDRLGPWIEPRRALHPAPPAARRSPSRSRSLRLLAGGRRRGGGSGPSSSPSSSSARRRRRRPPVGRAAADRRGGAQAVPRSPTPASPCARCPGPCPLVALGLAALPRRRRRPPSAAPRSAAGCAPPSPSPWRRRTSALPAAVDRRHGAGEPRPARGRARLLARGRRPPRRRRRRHPGARGARRRLRHLPLGQHRRPDHARADRPPVRRPRADPLRLAGVGRPARRPRPPHPGAHPRPRRARRRRPPPRRRRRRRCATTSSSSATARPGPYDLWPAPGRRARPRRAGRLRRRRSSTSRSPRCRSLDELALLDRRPAAPARRSRSSPSTTPSPIVRTAPGRRRRRRGRRRRGPGRRRAPPGCSTATSSIRYGASLGADGVDGRRRRRRRARHHRRQPARRAGGGRRCATRSASSRAPRRARRRPHRQPPAAVPGRRGGLADHRAAPRRRASATATSYGNPISFTPEYRPANAVDGDLAHRVAHRRRPPTSGASGSWSTFDPPVTADHVRLVQPLPARNRRITEVDLAFDGEPADAVAVGLDDTSVAGAGQIVTFAERTFSQLEIVLRGDTAGSPVRYGSFGFVGFAEVDVDGRQAHELVHLPTDLLAGPGAGDAGHPLTSRWSASGSTPPTPRATTPRPPSPGSSRCRRRGRSPSPAPARLSARATDDVVDDLLGATPRADVVRGAWRATPRLAAAALDGDPATWWSPGSARPREDWIQVDLRGARHVRPARAAGGRRRPALGAHPAAHRGRRGGGGHGRRSGRARRRPSRCRHDAARHRVPGGDRSEHPGRRRVGPRGRGARLASQLPVRLPVAIAELGVAALAVAPPPAAFLDGMPRRPRHRRRRARARLGERFHRGCPCAPAPRRAGLRRYGAGRDAGRRRAHRRDGRRRDIRRRHRLARAPVGRRGRGTGDRRVGRGRGQRHADLDDNRPGPGARGRHRRARARRVLAGPRAELQRGLAGDRRRPRPRPPRTRERLRERLVRRGRQCRGGVGRLRLAAAAGRAPAPSSRRAPPWPCASASCSGRAGAAGARAPARSSVAPLSWRAVVESSGAPPSVARTAGLVVAALVGGRW